MVSSSMREMLAGVWNAERLVARGGDDDVLGPGVVRGLRRPTDSSAAGGERQQRHEDERWCA